MTENDHITSALLAVVIIIITRNQYAPPREREREREREISARATMRRDRAKRHRFLAILYRKLPFRIVTGYVPALYVTNRSQRNGHVTSPRDCNGSVTCPLQLTASETVSLSLSQRIGQRNGNCNGHVTNPLDCNGPVTCPLQLRMTFDSERDLDQSKRVLDLFSCLNRFIWLVGSV